MSTTHTNPIGNFLAHMSERVPFLCIVQVCERIHCPEAEIDPWGPCTPEYDLSGLNGLTFDIGALWHQNVPERDLEVPAKLAC